MLISDEIPLKHTAYASGDEAWMLTAVFGMYYVSGFDDRILEALSSKTPAIQFVVMLAYAAAR